MSIVDKDFFDLDDTMEAARRYRDVLAAREEQVDAAKKGDVTHDRPDRIRKNAQYLIEKADQGGVGLPAELRRELRDIAEDSAPLADQFLERTIGKTRDYLSFAFLEDGLIAGRSVGRVIVPTSRGTAYGTGFLVSPALFLTNHHVLPDEETAARSSVEFDYETGRDGRPKGSKTFRLDPDRFFLADKAHDFALVAVGPSGNETAKNGTALGPFGFCPLVEQEGKILLGNAVNIIQHPNGEFKQVVLRENRLVNLENENGPNLFAHYTTDTEPGSSGSPVFNDQWDVIALHHSGVPAMNKKGQLLNVDGKVWTKAEGPERLCWVANEGIRVSRLVKFIKDAKLTGEKAALRDELLRHKEVGPAPETRLKEGGRGAVAERNRRTDRPGEPATRPEARPLQGGGRATVTIPVRITVEIAAGGAVDGGELAVDDLFEAAKKRVPKPDTDYATRAGFDPKFLGVEVRMPRLSNALKPDLLKPDGAAKGELKYHHYSVLMSKSRKLAFVSAVNIDGEAEYKEPRGSDRWYYDRRLDESDQAGSDLYGGNDLDRGHLTRRDDAAWGNTRKEARLGNDDTFHWTNCAPQHLVFNQSTKAAEQGLELWGNLENHVSAQLARGLDRLSVFNGPVFRASDRSYRGVQLPQEYWKLVAYKGDDGKAHALAFKLSQAELLDEIPEELTFDPGNFGVFQIKVRDLETLTRLDFGDLYKGDPLEQDGKESAFAAGTEIVPLRSLRDVVL